MSRFSLQKRQRNMKIKNFLVLFILTVFYAGVHAQLYYKFQYKTDDVRDTTVYKAFFVRYNDGNGFVRINFNQPGLPNPVLAELSLKEQYIEKKSGESGPDKFYYDTTSVPKFKPGTTNQQFPIPYFRFTFDPLAELLVPDGVFFKNNPGQSKAGILLDSIAIDKIHLLKDTAVLLRFFDKSDEFYVNLHSPNTRGGKPLVPDTKIILRIVANSNDQDIGYSCKKDMERMVQAFEDINDFMEFTDIDLDTISGSRYNIENVKKMIRDIKPAKNDIVVFYYSGHGFNDKGDYPFIELRNGKGKLKENSLNIKDIYDSICNKPGRVKLVISDCCNAAPEDSNAKGFWQFAPVRGDVDGSKENYLKLLCNPMSVLITAAEKGQKATSNDRHGGYFSECFLKVLENNLSKQGKDVSWDKLVAEAKKNTTELANRAYCDSPNKCKQIPRHVFF